MTIFKMPSLGADMEAGTLVEWLIKPGDIVKRGDVVAVVETQKGAIEIECFEDGTVQSLDAALGESLPVGTPLATLARAGETAPAQTDAPPPTKSTLPEPSPAPAPTPAPTKVTKVQPAPVRASATPVSPPASPAARALAAERRVDLAMLKGSGPGGAILLADVEAASPKDTAPTAPSAPAMPEPNPDPMRAAIASAMARSKREIPHYYLTRTIDLQTATDWLATTNQARDPDARLLLGAIFVRATAMAATKIPEVNGHYGKTGFQPSAAVHAGIAIARRGGGLIAPAIRDAETLDLNAVMVALRDLVARARTGRLRSSEMTDGTITISSLGDGGADAMAAVIFPPQVAILGFGTPVRRPWVVDDTIAPRMTVTVTLSGDHRVSDGRQGARFLAVLDHLLQTPEEL